MHTYLSEGPIASAVPEDELPFTGWIARVYPALRSRALWPLLLSLFSTFVLTYAAFQIIGQIASYTLLWPVSGLVIGLTLCSPPASWQERCLQYLAIGSGVFIGAITAGQSLWMALSWVALTLTDLLLAESLIGSHLHSFEDLKKRVNVVRFLVVTTVAPILSALLVTLPLALRHGIPWLQATSMSALSNSLGTAVVLPSVLFMMTGEYRALHRIAPHLRSAAGACAFFIVVTAVVFWQNSGPFLFIIFPPMMLVVLLLGLEGAVLSSIALSVIGWFATAHGHGPVLLMRCSSPALYVILLQVFIWICLATALPVGALLDERRRAERDVLEAQSIYHLLLQNTENAIVLSSMDGKRRYISPGVEHLLGWSPEEYLSFDRPELVHPDDRAMVTLLDESFASGKREHTLRFRLKHKSGGWRWVEGVIRGYGSGEVMGYVSTMRDISAQRQTEKAWQAERRALAEERQQMAALAGTDALTGLLNRRGLDSALSEGRSHAATAAVLMIDVDYFKQYNDTYGHAAGDECLKRLGSLIQEQASRRGDLIARLGGEEFTVILQGADATGARIVAKSILAGLQKTGMEHTNSPLGFVSVSIGIAWHGNAQDADFNLLLAQADQALYTSKHQGKNRATVFEPVFKVSGAA